MKAETGAALIAAGGEERIEGFAPDIEAHPRPSSENRISHRRCRLPGP